MSPSPSCVPLSLVSTYMASSGTSVFDVVSWVFDMDVTLHKQQASTRLGLANSLKPVVDVFVCFTYGKSQVPSHVCHDVRSVFAAFRGFCMYDILACSGTGGHDVGDSDPF